MYIPIESGTYSSFSLGGRSHELLATMKDRELTTERHLSV